MKKILTKYSRKPKTSLKERFAKIDKLSQPLDEQINDIKSLREEKVNPFALIFGYAGIFLIAVGAINLIPIISMIFYPDEFSRVLAFLLPGLLSIGVGTGLTFLLKGKSKVKLQKNQDVLLLIIIWLLACLFGSISFMLPDYIGDFRLGGLGLNFVQAQLESVSMYTTTGLTMCEGTISPSQLLTGDGHCFLLYRSTLAFFGGVGLVLVLTLFLNDRYGVKLFFSEGHTDRLLPNLYRSTRLIFAIYSGITILGAIALWLVGMNSWTIIDKRPGCEIDPVNSSFFEALCTAMSHISCAGITCRDLSIYAYNNVGIEIVCSIISLIGSTNFFVVFSVLTFKFKKLVNDIDFRIFIVLFLVFVPLLTLLSCIIPSYQNDLLSFKDSLHYTVYTYISAVTTNGSMNTTELTSAFPKASMFILAIAMTFGAQAGSTGGGIKLNRIGISLKNIYWTLKEKGKNSYTVSPHFYYKYGELKKAEAQDINEANTYILLQFIILFVFSIFTVLITNNETDFTVSLFEIASALSNTGLSSGITHQDANSFILILLTVSMFIGRLEIFTFIYAGKTVFQSIGNLFNKKKKIQY